ncbi:hypothetical protein KC573_03035, partial [candidate division WWE3 bacterium]|nr:hypothetical protein [candidate division WWE3 bacterium]
EFSFHREDVSQKINLPPTRRGAKGEITESNEQDEDRVDEGKSHFLNAKIITDQFAEKGIVCSILKPSNREELSSIKETAVKLVTCADIIILDWQLHNDNGALAQEFIRQIATNHGTSSNQLRLITIYTGEPDLLSVAEKIDTTLKEQNVEVQRDKSTPILIVDSIKVIVLAKKASGVALNLRPYEVDFSELANKVTQEFTSMTAGLISNAVLMALTEIRQNTFKILNNFSKDLDAPFLTHRVLQVDPRDAEEHLTSLLAEELQAILEEAQIGQKTTNLEMIKSWLMSTNFRVPTTDNHLPLSAVKKLRNIQSANDIETHKRYIENQNDISDAHKEKLHDIYAQDYDDLEQLKRVLMPWIDANSELSDFLSSTDQDIFSLLASGIRNWGAKPRGLKDDNSHTFHFTKLFSGSAKDNFNLDEQLAFVSSTRSFYGNDTRKLTLGTIVECDADDGSKYLICVQPKCDTYRLVEPRVFLFLPLSSVLLGELFNIVVKGDGTYLRLALEKKPYQLVLLEFSPDQELQIVITEGGEYTTTDDKKYKWIAELRFEHAQRISNRLATELSRVGVNESQWLRRWAKE